MKLSMQKIDNQIIELSNNIEIQKNETITYLRNKNRKMALISLKREKLLKDVQEKRYNSLSMLEEVLFKIKSTQMDAEVIDVISVASKTLKNIMKNTPVDKVDEVMDELQDVLADHKEIEDALTAGYNEANAMDDDELEQELLNLISDSHPPVPETTPLLKVDMKQEKSIEESEEIISLLEKLDTVSGLISPVNEKETTTIIEQLDKASEMQLA